MLKMEGYYDVSYDRPRKLIRISTYGFWNMEVARHFERAIDEVARISGGKSDTLLNICRTEIHTPEVSEALARISSNHDHVTGGRIAVVVSSMLLRMQTKRMQAADAHYGYFDSEEAALEWLESGKALQPSANPNGA